MKKSSAESKLPGLRPSDSIKNGQLIEVSVTYSPIQDTLGNVVAVSGIARDITERKQREKEQKRLPAILEATTDFVATADAHGRVLYYNKTAGRSRSTKLFSLIKRRMGKSSIIRRSRAISPISKKRKSFCASQTGFPSPVNWRPESSMKFGIH